MKVLERLTIEPSSLVAVCESTRYFPSVDKVAGDDSYCSLGFINEQPQACVLATKGLS